MMKNCYCIIGSRVCGIMAANGNEVIANSGWRLKSLSFRCQQLAGVSGKVNQGDEVWWLLLPNSSYGTAGIHKNLEGRMKNIGETGIF